VTTPLTIVSPGELNALRTRWRKLTEAGGLLSELGRADQARELYREADDLVARRYAVEHPCLLCREPVPVERSLHGPPTTIESVICGQHGDPPNDITALLLS
jgi:hypothetical protein